MEKHGNIKRIKGGSNCNVYVYAINKDRYVIKVSGNGFVDREIGLEIIKDYIRIKNKLSKNGVIVPETKNIYITSSAKADLVIIEKYCGISLKEILKSKRITLNLKVLLVKKCIKQIQCFPEDVPLDTNPGNFVVHRGLITFVDFTPPDPWKYPKNSYKGKLLSKVFTSINSPSYKNKKLSYYKNIFRIERFKYHCKKLCPGFEKYP